MRMTVVAALIIPAAIAITLVAIPLFGETLNIMSVGGLAVAVGLIIDDAIVVVENISRSLHDASECARAAAVTATMRESIAPMTASDARDRRRVRAARPARRHIGILLPVLALTLTSALTVSLGLALFVTPPLFAAWLGRGRAQRRGRNVAAAYDAVRAGSAFVAHQATVVYAVCRPRAGRDRRDC